MGEGVFVLSTYHHCRFIYLTWIHTIMNARMDPKLFTQNIWSRARRDTKIAFRSIYTWVAQVVSFPVAVAIALSLAPEQWSNTQTAWFTAAVAIAGAMIFAWSIYLMSLVLAPFRQRNEARSYSHQERERYESELESLRSQLDEREQRSTIRSQLASLIEQGEQLVRQCRNQTIDPPEKEADEWSSQVESYLASNLGDDYIATFRSHDGLPMGTTTLSSARHRQLESGLKTRLARLQQFLIELRR